MPEKLQTSRNSRFDEFNAHNRNPLASDYDRDGVLMAEEIEALKARLLLDPELLKTVCAYGARLWMRDQNKPVRIDVAATIGDEWAYNLDEVLRLPADEWPEDVGSPTKLAYVLESYDALHRPEAHRG